MPSDSLRSLTVFPIIFLVELSYEYFVIQLNRKLFSSSWKFAQIFKKGIKILKIQKCSRIHIWKQKKITFGKYFQGKKASQFLEMIKQGFIKIFHLSFS